MGNRERLAAAALFLVTGLVLPVVFSMEKPLAPEAHQVPYLLRQAFFELRMDLALHYSVSTLQGEDARPQADAESPSKAGPLETEVDGEGGSARAEPFEIPATAFHLENWLAIGSEMEADARTRLYDGLAPLAAAMGRRADAQMLLRRAGHVLPEGAAWGCLLADPPAAGEELSLCLERQGDLPPEASAYAVVLASHDLSRGMGPGTELFDALSSLLMPFLHRLAALVLLGALLFLTGVVLLFLAPRLVRRFRVSDYGLQGYRFSATPLATYLVFLAWFTVMITVHVLVAAGAQHLGLDMARSRVAVTVTAYVLYALGGLVLILRLGGPQVSPLTKAVDMQVSDVSVRALLFGAGAYMIALPVVLMFTHLSSLLFGTGPEVNPAIPQLLEADGPADRWGLVLNVCVIAPLFEEVFFRGFLFQQFKRHFSLPNAVALSALVFASVHLSIESFLPLFALGVLMALVYHFVQSLWASIVLHMLWNGATVGVVLLLFT